MDTSFKVPSTVPQDLLLIQDLIGPLPVTELVSDSLDSSNDDDSIASSDNQVESEVEVEADLAVHDEDSEVSVVSSDAALHSDSELDTSSTSDPEEDEIEMSQQNKVTVDIEDEDLGVTVARSYLQTKNEIVDANIMVPNISEVDPQDTLERIGEIMTVVGDTVIVKGLPVDHVTSLSERALDAESLLVFHDRKVLGYIFETFGPTSQPLYQVKFNQHYPLDPGRIWLSREVFHVPKRSHFVFVDQLKKLRGSDASNIHDEEPADDEIEFSDDEQEAAFRAQRKRRGRSTSSSRQSTPARVNVDIVQDTYIGSNPYDAHGPYDDDFHVTGPSRPLPVPYDDPYADVPTSDLGVDSVGMNCEFRERPKSEGGDGLQAFRGRVSDRGTRGRGYRNSQPWSTAKRRYRHPHTSQRTFDSNTDQTFPPIPRVTDCATGYAQAGDAITPDPFIHSAWPSPEINHTQTYPQSQSFIQPHINPRFASIFGLNLPSGSMDPRASAHNPHNHATQPQHWTNTWTIHDDTGSNGQGDTYRTM